MDLADRTDAFQAMVAMRDGTRLNTFVFLPNNRGPRWPVILHRTPYGITTPGARDKTDCTRAWLPSEEEPFRGSILRGWRNIVAHGYAAVYQDTRGRHGSEGEDRVYADDAADGYDILEWIAAQPWTNQMVGMSGSSAGATTTFASASTRHPSLRAFFAQAGASSIYDDVVYEGQSIEMERLWLWVARNIPGLSLSHREAVMQRSGISAEALDVAAASAAARYARLDTARQAEAPFIGSADWMRLPLTRYPDFAAWQPFLDEIITHPAPDAFRARHNFRRTIDIPGFHVTTSSNFPRRARNTNSGHPVLANDGEADIRVANNTVHHAAATPSYIELPVLTCLSEGPQIRVGIGGWVFPPWRGVFYPPGLPQARELGYASRQLTTIEINGTFYGPQTPASFRRWHDETPEDFVFSIKGPRFATHRPDLAGAGSTLDRFFSSGVLELRDKLGPILWQFPPGMPADEGAFAAFIELLPERIDGRTVRHVVELRHPKVPVNWVVDLLRRHRVALVVGDSRTDFEVTADFIYVHLRHCTIEEPTGYPPDEIDGWAQRLRERSGREARDCFVYFISGAKVRAPAAAQALLQRLTLAA